MNIEKINVGGNLYDSCDAKARAMISDEYDQGKSYAAGDLCIHDNKLYAAIEFTTGAWDGTKWEEKTIAEIIGEQNSKIPFTPSISQEGEPGTASIYYAYEISSIAYIGIELKAGSNGAYLFTIPEKFKSKYNTAGTFSLFGSSGDVSSKCDGVIAYGNVLAVRLSQPLLSTCYATISYIIDF